MFKKYMAIVGGVCAVTLTLVVALRIAPEAWAVIAGILFGGLASVPMCFIAYMLVRRSPAASPPTHAQQPQIIIMRDDGTMLPRRQPQAYVAAPQYAEADYVEGDYYEYEQPTTPRPAYGTRIVNQQPSTVRVIGGRR